jgi:hypothetical protein
MHDATNFWLLAGTSAPLIILANVVLLGDAFKLTCDFRSILRSNKASANQNNSAKAGLRNAYIALGISEANLVVLSTVLIVALQFFASGSGDGFSATLIDYILLFGMATLLAGSLFSGLARHSATEVKSASYENVPQNAPVVASQGAAPVNIADELTKLVQLRDAGALSPEQFDQAKAKLLG